MMFATGPERWEIAEMVETRQVTLSHRQSSTQPDRTAKQLERKRTGKSSDVRNSIIGMRLKLRFVLFTKHENRKPDVSA